VHVIEYLSEVPHIDERTADRAVTEMIRLGAHDAVSIDTGIARHCHRSFHLKKSEEAAYSGGSIVGLFGGGRSQPGRRKQPLHVSCSFSLPGSADKPVAFNSGMGTFRLFPESLCFFH
jgi:hypothetical protein